VAEVAGAGVGLSLSVSVLWRNPIPGPVPVGVLLGPYDFGSCAIAEAAQTDKDPTAIIVNISRFIFGPPIKPEASRFGRGIYRLPAAVQSVIKTRFQAMNFA